MVFGALEITTANQTFSCAVGLKMDINIQKDAKS